MEFLPCGYTFKVLPSDINRLLLKMLWIWIMVNYWAFFSHILNILHVTVQLIPESVSCHRHLCHSELLQRNGIFSCQALLFWELSLCRLPRKPRRSWSWHMAYHLTVTDFPPAVAHDFLLLTTLISCSYQAENQW